MKQVLTIATFSLWLITSTASAVSNDCDGPVLAILVDVSEDLPKPAQLAFASLTQRLITLSPEGGILAVYSIDLAASDTARERARMCVPKFSEYKGDKFKQRKLDKFQLQATEAMQAASTAPAPSKSSPILESVFKMVHNEFLSSRTARSGRIVVVSDFFQNSEVANFYRSVPAYDSWAKSVGGRQWSTQVKQIAFTAVALPRENFKDEAELLKVRNFWINYIRNNFNFCGWSGLSNAAMEVANVCR